LRGSRGGQTLGGVRGVLAHFSFMLAAGGEEKMGVFGDTPNPGRAASPPAPLTCNQFRRRDEKSLLNPARGTKRKGAKCALSDILPRTHIPVCQVA